MVVSAARSPAVRISLTVATFKTSRKSVKASNSDGKTDNSSGLETYIVVTITITESVMLKQRRISNTPVGSGMRITRTRLMKAMGKSIPRLSRSLIRKGWAGMAAMGI